jgi:hypothetical protein
MTPRVGDGDGEGDTVAEIVGLETGETVTDWVPAVVPSAQTTMTV